MSERAPTIGCTNCGWCVELPLVGQGQVSIEPVDGWEIVEDRVLCDRCVSGWQPRRPPPKACCSGDPDCEAHT